MASPKFDRGSRRASTEKVALRRRFTEDHVWGRLKDRPSRPLGVWKKHGVETHHCRKRRHGNPKVGGGICRINARYHVIFWRQANRQLGRILEIEYDQCSDAVAALYPKRAMLTK